ncbi:MAG: restriction endonuclease subunit S [Akkermansia sp.]|nr:restriction endonuclease subunit S [Akkermansia sp.]
MKSEMVSVGIVCRSVSSTYARTDSTVVLINTSDVFEGKILNHKCVTNENLKGQFKKTFCPNDILYSEIRPANKRYAFVKEEDVHNYIASTKLMVIRADERKVLPSYLYAYLTMPSVLAELQRQAESRSGTFPQITFAEVAALLMPLPSLPTQRKIAAILSSLDDKIENNNAICRNLEEQAAALYRSWFVDFEPFGGQRPSSWIERDIYSVAEIIYGAPFASKLFNREKRGTPIIRIRDLKIQDSEVYTDEIHPKAYVISPGDIVVGMDGEFQPYIWGGVVGLLNQRVCVFRNRRSKGEFFLYFTIRPQLDFIQKTEMATTVIHIGKQDFDAFRVNLPPDDILDRFDALTHPLYDRIISLRMENRRLSILRDILLPKLMRGEIDVENNIA